MGAGNRQTERAFSPLALSPTVYDRFTKLGSDWSGGRAPTSADFLVFSSITTTVRLAAEQLAKTVPEFETLAFKAERLNNWVVSLYLDVVQTVMTNEQYCDLALHYWRSTLDLITQFETACLLLSKNCIRGYPTEYPTHYDSFIRTGQRLINPTYQLTKDDLHTLRFVVQDLRSRMNQLLAARQTIGYESCCQIDFQQLSVLEQRLTNLVDKAVQLANQIHNGQMPTTQQSDNGRQLHQQVFDFQVRIAALTSPISSEPTEEPTV